MSGLYPHSFFPEIFHNRIFLTTTVVWVLAQTIKVFLGVLREKRFNFRWFIGTGGMPSSHAAGASSLATSVGLEYGFNSPLFAVAAVFALVTMFDAQGVRRATGYQATILNKMMDDIYWKGQIEEEKLKELVGHTPIEVLAGFAFGVICAMILY
ncbi:MAG: divergent PAP2 family protein [Candidatus Omnitrophica bacterium]|nr:divergent PAP2 family protein [Candidatus Omnitrophota bacterium]MDE2009433.1 divergent PAP2 family protein [Candidatus Omnitrophota bacterium]MDE2214644.1 divergent PAP2 family protein [Candidatus Omnitrophota bacterium]MDE2231813.1 divergent PAP2 family protein [Candidatus Omnitrophota bacterium]